MLVRLRDGVDEGRGGRPGADQVGIRPAAAQAWISPAQDQGDDVPHTVALQVAHPLLLILHDLPAMADMPVSAKFAMIYLQLVIPLGLQAPGLGRGGASALVPVLSMA